MSYNLTTQSFDSLASSWAELRHRLEWGSVFVLPRWLEVWWHEFGAGAELRLSDVREDGNIIGIAAALQAGASSPRVQIYLLTTCLKWNP